MTTHNIKATRSGYRTCLVLVSLRDWNFEPFGQGCDGFVEFTVGCSNDSRPIDILSDLYNKAQDCYDLSGMSVRMIDNQGEET